MDGFDRRQHRAPEELRELASWYRQFAERAGSAAIWEARVRMAEDPGTRSRSVERRTPISVNKPPGRPAGGNRASSSPVILRAALLNPAPNVDAPSCRRVLIGGGADRSERRSRSDLSLSRLAQLTASAALLCEQTSAVPAHSGPDRPLQPRGRARSLPLRRDGLFARRGPLPLHPACCPRPPSPRFRRSVAWRRRVRQWPRR